MPAKQPKDQGQQPEAQHEIVSPRDHASGLPTGKRMHKPMAMGAELGPTGPGQGPTASQLAYGETGGSEEEQMRLQMTMDRKSKSETTLSNIMKKESDTADNITHNMK